MTTGHVSHMTLIIYPRSYQLHKHGPTSTDYDYPVLHIDSHHLTNSGMRLNTY